MLTKHRNTPVSRLDDEIQKYTFLGLSLKQSFIDKFYFAIIH